MGDVQDPLHCGPASGSERVDQVLAGLAPYDSLSEPEQAVVREAWAELIAARRNNLNFEAEFEAAGESFSEAAEDGAVVVREARR